MELLLLSIPTLLLSAHTRSFYLLTVVLLALGAQQSTTFNQSIHTPVFRLDVPPGISVGLILPSLVVGVVFPALLHLYLLTAVLWVLIGFGVGWIGLLGVWIGYVIQIAPFEAVLMLSLCYLSHLLIVRALPSVVTYGEHSLIGSLASGYIVYCIDYLIPSSPSVETVHLLECAMLFGLLSGLLVSSVFISKEHPILSIGSSLLVCFVNVEILGHLLIKQDPLLWTLAFITQWDVLLLMLYWIAIIGGAIYIASDWKSTQLRSSQHVDFRRKYFHLLVIVMFTPAYFIQPLFLHLGFVVALCAGTFLELFRACKIWPMHPYMDEFFKPFLDARDQGPVILSHIYLLTGCALPVWLSSDPIVLQRLCGILSIGVGDALASTVGKAIGRTKWKDRRKSVEGTCAFVFGVGLSFILLESYLGVNTMHSGVWISIILTALLEAFSDQNDNIVIPLYFFCCLRLIY